MTTVDDRTWWRGCSTQELIEAAKDSNHELCIALGERLKEIDASKDYDDDDY